MGALFPKKPLDTELIINSLHIKNMKAKSKANTSKHQFIDAQQMHKNYPTTFSVPAKKELDNIQTGDNVKVCAYRERFWVKVTKVEGEKVTGIVANVLLTQRLNFGDVIVFEKRNIYTIWY